MNPRFFVIGAYRSGTTSLYRQLRQHPGVFLPLEKEPNFFAVDGNPDASTVLQSRAVTSREAYEALYARREPAQVAGDISPEYLANPYVAGHLASVVPDAKLVAVLRNPVERAWSDFLLHRRDGNEPCETIGEALTQQAARTTGGDHRAGHYIETGKYAEQLGRYLEHFGQEQLHVVLFEDLRSDPEATMRGIYRHIGVDESFVADDEAAINASGVPTNPVVAGALRFRKYLRPLVSRSVLEQVRPLWDAGLQRFLDKPELSATDRATLAELYHDDIIELQNILNRDLGHWLEATNRVD